MSEAVRAFASARCDASDPAHDILHLQRVVANSRRIAAGERARGRDTDPLVVELAAWLHDLVQVPKGSGPPGEAARRSAAEASSFLQAHGVEPAVVQQVASAIESHAFSAGLTPASLEAAVLQDADRLDALGAVGLARLWATGVLLGGSFYHPGDPQGLDRELDDKTYSLDHIERKLARLPALMNTETGREEAERRWSFTQHYRHVFLRELDYASSHSND